MFPTVTRWNLELVKQFPGVEHCSTPQEWSRHAGAPLLRAGALLPPVRRYSDLSAPGLLHTLSGFGVQRNSRLPVRNPKPGTRGPKPQTDLCRLTLGTQFRETAGRSCRVRYEEAFAADRFALAGRADGTAGDRAGQRECGRAQRGGRQQRAVHQLRRPLCRLLLRCAEPDCPRSQRPSRRLRPRPAGKPDRTSPLCAGTQRRQSARRVCAGHQRERPVRVVLVERVESGGGRLRPVRRCLPRRPRRGHDPPDQYRHGRRGERGQQFHRHQCRRLPRRVPVRGHESRGGR